MSRVFISYSHADAPWRDRLVTTLAPVVRQDEMDVWHDGQITAGADWNAAIDAQLARSKVAVLLVSASFLGSDYIAQVELPHVVEAARAGRQSLIWVPVSASLWDMTPLAPFQAAINPNRALDQMSSAEANQALVSVAKTINGKRTLTDVGSGLGIVDAVTDELEPGGQHRVVAHHTGTRVTFVQDGVGVPIETITAEELELLPDLDHRLVQSFEASMSAEYERWIALRPRRATLTGSEKQEYQDAGRRMCEELNRLLDFLQQGLGKQLQDHYGGIRYSCTELVALDH